MAYVYREGAFWPSANADDEVEKDARAETAARVPKAKLVRDACVECGRAGWTAGIWDDLGRFFCRECWFGGEAEGMGGRP